MTDSTHEVKIIFKANTKEMDEALKKANDSAKKSQGQSTAQQKQVEKLGKAQKLNDKTGGPKAQKMVNKELQQHNKELKTQLDLLKKINTEEKRKDAAAKKARSQGFMGGLRSGLGMSDKSFSRRNFGQSVGVGARAGLGLVGGGMAAIAAAPFAAVGSDYAAYNAYAMRKAGLAGLHKGGRVGLGNNGYTSASADELRDKMVGLGYAPEEALSNAQLYGRRAAGGSRVAAFGMGASRTTGIDNSQLADMFGTMRSGEGGQFGDKGMKEFAKIMAGATKAGVNASTLPEMLQGISGLTSRASAGLGGVVSSMSYAQILSLFGKSGSPGLQGERGANVLSNIEQGFKNPAGDEGKAFIMNALGFGKMGGGGTSYMDAIRQMEQGFSGKGGGAALSKVFNASDARFGGNTDQSDLYLKSVLGGNVSTSQIDDVRGAIAGGKSTDEISKMYEDMTKTEAGWLETIDGHLTDLLGASVNSAGIQKANIDRGALYKDAILELQRSFEHFLTAFAQPIAEAMNVLVPFITQNLEPLLVSMAGYLSDLAGGGPSADTMYAGAQTADKDVHRLGAKAELYEGGIGTPTADELRQMIADYSADKVAIGTIEEHVNTRGVQRAADIVDTGGAHHATAAQLHEDSVAIEHHMRRMVEILETQTHDPAETARLLQQVGLNVQPSVRAHPSHSGGGTHR